MPSTTFLYWIGNQPQQTTEFDQIVYVESIEQLPEKIGGAVCFDFTEPDKLYQSK
ncbi:hypothetical protein [Vibrio sp. TRT 2004]|uniref:hypothetical protein n=1 Tax=Vibrio sp. TRT 2004 TaxID=3418506 RepID=UPI003CECC3DD